MIVKLQAPLNNAKAPIMVYNQRRTIRQYLPLETLPAAVRLSLAASPKVFWDAKYELAGDLTFLRQKPYQPW